MDPVFPGRDAEHERVFRASHHWILERTVAIYKQMPPAGNPVLEGSGVLLRIADASFLISAAHVLLAAQEARILIAPMSSPSRLVQLSPFTCQISNDRDDIDVGYVRLRDEVVAELEKYEKRFARLSDLELVDSGSEGLYSVTGYPKVVNTPDYVAKACAPTPFHYGTYLYRGEVSRFVPGISIAVDWTSTEVRMPSGHMGRMPEVGGISGCGMWLLQRFRNPDRTPGTIRLAGIEHTVSTRRWIKGTLIGHVVKMLADDYPDLRASIRLTLPD